MIELEYCYRASSEEVMDLGNSHQRPLTTKGRWQLDIFMPRDKSSPQHLWSILAQKSNLMNPLLIYRKYEGQMNISNDITDAISKVQMWEKGWRTYFLQQICSWGKRGGGTLQIKRLKGHYQQIAAYGTYLYSEPNQV